MLVVSLRFQAPLAEQPPPLQPELPDPIVSEDFADGSYHARGWLRGYQPQVVDAQLQRSVYQIRWAGASVPVAVAGTTKYPLIKRLSRDVKEMTVAFKVIEVVWGQADGAHFIGTIPKQDMREDGSPTRAGHLSNSSGRFYFEPTVRDFRWGGIMQANYTNGTGWKYFNSANNVMKLGHWHEIVTHARQNTVGASDGVYRVSMRRRAIGAGGAWGPWSQIVNATFGGMVTTKNPSLVQSWITIEPWGSALTSQEMRLCDLRVYEGNQYDPYKKANS